MSREILSSCLYSNPCDYHSWNVMSKPTDKQVQPIIQPNNYWMKQDIFTDSAKTLSTVRSRG